MYAEQLAAFEEPSTRANGATNIQPEHVSFRPESPFLPEPEYALEHQPDISATQSTSSPTSFREAIETPFITQYALEGVESESAEGTLLREIMEDLYDEEFEEALEDLVHHVKGVYEERFQGELEHSTAQSEQQMSMYLETLNGEIEGALDKLIEGLTQFDNENLTEEQLDQYLENFEYETNFEEPEFENFFKKLWKKAKKLAKKGLKVLKKFSPIHIILGKLKKLVRPLLKRVLKFALNKVPTRFRPLAKRLARRFFKGALGEVDESDFDGELVAYEEMLEQSEQDALDPEAAAPPPSVIATEFDALLAGYLIEGPDFDHDPSVVQYLYQGEVEEEDTADTLDKARDRFIRKVVTVETEEQAVAEIERFIPAILMGLKLGIKVIGRRRVVNFLAKLVSKLIRKFVGRKAAVPLSRALVDAGLRLVSLETAEDLDYASGEVVAETIEDTVSEFVSTAPEDAYEDDELLELYVQEAFDKAVAKNFPPLLVRRNLRQAPASKGTWVVLPRGRRRKRYKKFSETFNVKLTAPMAKRIRSFGGKSLYGFLKDQLGLPIDKQSVSGRLHVYEGIRGTSLSDISHLERRVDGLGSRARSSWMKIHPLTPQAASVLMPKHVGLARRVSSRFLLKRTRTAVGQRFYYLEIPSARLLRAPATKPDKVGSRKIVPQTSPAKASEVNTTIDFRSREIIVYDFLSEAKSTQVAQDIRRGQSRVALVRSVRSSLSSGLRMALSGASGNQLRIKREVSAEEGIIAGVAPILRFVGRTVSKTVTNFVVKGLLMAMRKDGNEFAQRFVKAAEAPADGVTLIFTLSRVGEVLDVFSANTRKRVRALAKLRASGVSGAMKIEVKPGIHKS